MTNTPNKSEINKKSAFLAKVPLFFLMKKRDLRRLVKGLQDQMFEKGQVIIKEGDRDNRLFIIISGRVAVVKDSGTRHEKRLATLGPDNYFGEMALIDDMVRTASVIADSNTHVYYLDHWDLRKAIEKYPVLAIELLQMLCRRIRAIEKNLMQTLGGTLPICAQCKKIRRKDQSWVPIETYIGDRSDAEFTHGICPDCSQNLFQDPI
jgi:CRP/FNR family cyclic AMP-dependent transcriptional regulator